MIKVKKFGLNDLESNIMNNINKLLDETKRERKELANYLGVTYTTVTRYCLGVNSPRIDTLVKICEFFGASIYEIINVESSHNTEIFSKDEIEIIRSYRQKKDEVKEIVKKILDVNNVNE